MNTKEFDALYEKRKFIDSIIDNNKLMSATMHQWCVAEKGKKSPNSWKNSIRVQ